MNLLKNSSLWVGSVYFLTLLSIAFWVRDIPNQPDTFTLTLPQFIQVTTIDDPGFFARAAIDIVENGWISTSNMWILNLWPPGFILLEALVLKILGPEAPVILVLQILAAMLFSVVLTLLYSFLRDKLDSKTALILPLLIFIFPMSRVFLLEPTGISLGESFSIGFFLIFILLGLRSVTRNSLAYAVYAGLSLALSAYFRSQFEIIILALTAWGVVLIVALQFARVRQLVDQQNIKSAIKSLVVVLVVAHAVMIPWRAYHWVNQQSPNWVFTSSVTFGNSVLTSEALEAKDGGFVVAGGGNLVCRIDPTTCNDTANAKALFIKTFLENPVEWYSLKLEVIGDYWFSSVQNWTAIGIAPAFMDYVVNGFLLIVLLAIIALMLLRKARMHEAWLLLMWVNISLYSTYFLIITVQQFEARYFYFPKIVGLLMIIIVASLFLRTEKKPIQSPLAWQNK